MGVHSCLLLFCTLLAVGKGFGKREWPGSDREEGGWSDVTRGGKLSSSVSVDLSRSVFQVSEQFLSVTIDAGQIKNNWKIIDFELPRVLNMAKGLSPALLRVGGTSEDFIIFKESTEQEYSSPVTGGSAKPQDSNFTMNSTQWDAVNVFTQKVGWDFIFGLNVLLRHPWPTGSWDSSDAELLMDYTNEKGYKVQWELGNEPDLFHEVMPTVPVSPEQDAKDFSALRELVQKKSSGSKFIAGPDTASGTGDFFSRFLEAIDSNVLNAASWHHYYTNGHTATLSDFTDVDLLDKFIDAIATVRQHFKQYMKYPAELWLGETSSCYGGGAPGLSDAYVAGFMWLDKLGVAALYNHTRILRQDFVGGNYALLNSQQYPLPDYWLSLLYKRLVGTKVLYVKDSLKKGRYIRVYAHCAKAPYPTGSVVLLVLNLNQEKSSVSLEDKELSTSSRDVYWLTPPRANITSQQVTLNGHLLELVKDTELPELNPESQPASSTISLPPLSFGFYVFKDTKAPACL